MPITQNSAVVCVALALAACQFGPQEPSVSIGGKHFRVEIADSPAEQRVGLMFRESLADDAGMLFVFPFTRDRGFWMKNCKIALDIIYFDSNLELINFHTSAPPCKKNPCPTYPSDAPAQYVLELAGGTAERIGLERGDVIELNIGTPAP